LEINEPLLPDLNDPSPKRFYNIALALKPHQNLAWLNPALELAQ
jgi:hypothetical protein